MGRGGMVFTFFKAQGLPVGSSLVEEDKVSLAKELEEKAKAKGVSLLLPTDIVIADKFAADAESKVVSADAIPDGWMVRSCHTCMYGCAERGFPGFCLGLLSRCVLHVW
jgi:3-phosphoglycerate kinase